MVRWLVFIFMGLALAGFAGPAMASDEVFTVRGIAVDASAGGAADAREIAITEGQRAAFNRLIQRLTRRQDWSSLQGISSEQVADLVLGFEVSQERSSATRYIARVTYSFKPGAIRALLRGSGIPFSEARAKPALVLPVFETPSATVLFEEPNPWREAWSRRDLGEELVPILTPLADLEDARYISASAAPTAGWGDVASIASKYGLDRVIVAFAKASPGGALDVRLTQLSSLQAPSSTSFNFAGGGNLDTMLDQAVDAALMRLYEEWKSQTIVDFAQANSLVASVTFNSLQQWLTIRRRLDDAPTVTGMDIIGLSPQGALIRVRYAGTIGQLQITLEQLSLRLIGRGSYWEIAMTDRGSAPPPSASNFDSAPSGASAAPAPETPLWPRPAGTTDDTSGAIQGGVDPSLVTTVPGIRR